MERSIAPPPDPVPLPLGVAIRTSTGPEDDPLLHAIIESAFVDHFGNEPQALASWQAENADILQDRDLILIASVDGVPAGVLTSFVPSGIGWIGELGVLTEFRERGIGRALLEAAFVALASCGATIARLNVDGANETGATRLYERPALSRWLAHWSLPARRRALRRHRCLARPSGTRRAVCRLAPKLSRRSQASTQAQSRRPARAIARPAAGAASESRQRWAHTFSCYSC
jgi:ribosomal protein S18 acetylase RimI-like enzyme